MSAAVQCELEFVHDSANGCDLFCFLPWLARAAPEDLYLPLDLVCALHVPCSPEDTLELLRGHRASTAAQPPPRPSGPTRNGPCPCGSGKKYKRCCGGPRHGATERLAA